MKYAKIILFVSIPFFMMGCMTITTFKKEIEINAPASVVFSVITDYESYPRILPMLHDSVKIVSENKEGLGVEWESTGSFKGHKFTSTWTVTEYEKNSKVVMKDLKSKIGETTLVTSSISDSKTNYSMYISTKMYKPYENDFIKIYEKEMDIIKDESEKIVSKE